MAKANPSKPLMIVPCYVVVDPDNPNQSLNWAGLTPPSQGHRLNPLLLIMGFAIAAAIVLPAFEGHQGQSVGSDPTVMEQQQQRHD